jgi:glycosyltransferase involved in cell wall biosynthesis
MRVGHNPALFIEQVAQPAEITVTVVNCIPLLSGYHEQSLAVLEAALESLHATREAAHPYDVMVFDNHSCAEVRAYLQEANKQGKIQYLVLSDTNIGKIGAWNYMFGAAAGKYIVFADGDVAFRPGWLSASLALFDAFPNVGMVSARPLRSPMEYSTATLEWARQAGVLEEGRFLDWETFWEHVESLGRDEADMRREYETGSEYRLTFGGQKAFIGAVHFQFMARREVLQKVIPLPSAQPMRGERALDVAINGMGLLRLTTEKPLVRHLGNVLPPAERLPAPAPQRKSLLKRLIHLPGIRHFLLWLQNQIFRLYFSNVD